MGYFTEILHQLSGALNLPLQPNQRGGCLLTFDPGIQIQLEFEDVRQRLLMASLACDVPPGRFREEIFKECLKMNSHASQEVIYAFVENRHQLLLFTYLYSHQFQPSIVIDSLTRLVQQAASCKENIKRGVLPLFSP